MFALVEIVFNCILYWMLNNNFIYSLCLVMYGQYKSIKPEKGFSSWFGSSASWTYSQCHFVSSRHTKPTSPFRCVCSIQWWRLLKYHVFCLSKKNFWSLIMESVRDLLQSWDSMMIDIPYCNERNSVTSILVELCKDSFNSSSLKYTCILYNCLSRWTCAPLYTLSMENTTLSLSYLFLNDSNNSEGLIVAALKVGLKTRLPFDHQI